MRTIMMLCLLTACDLPTPTADYEVLHRWEESGLFERAFPPTPVAMGLPAFRLARQSDDPVVRAATVHLSVDSVPAIATRIAAAAGDLGGRLVATREQHAERVIVHQTIHLPSDRLAAFLGNLRTIGDVLAFDSHSEIVGAQLHDFDARLRNARVLEERLLRLLSGRAGDLEDALAAERELARVRTEIEQTESARQRLRDRVAEARVELSIEAPISRPGIADAVWIELLDALLGALRAGIVLVGFLIPAGGLALVGVVAWRRFRV